MIESLLGNLTKERILLYLFTQKSGYAREISRHFNISLRSVQLQLKTLEDGGIIVAFQKGRTQLFQFNPRFFLYKELMGLLEKVYEAVPKTEKDLHYRLRKRPRKRGKP